MRREREGREGNGKGMRREREEGEESIRISARLLGSEIY